MSRCCCVPEAKHPQPTPFARTPMGAACGNPILQEGAQHGRGNLSVPDALSSACPLHWWVAAHPQRGTRRVVAGDEGAPAVQTLLGRAWCWEPSGSRGCPRPCHCWAEHGLQGGDRAAWATAARQHGRGLGKLCRPSPLTDPTSNPCSGRLRATDAVDGPWSMAFGPWPLSHWRRSP